MSWLDLFKKDKEILKKNNNRIYYNQEEIIMEHVNNKDKVYLIDMRNFLENIIKESYSVDKDSKEDIINLIDLIGNEDLKTSLHEMRKRANSVAHDLNSSFDYSKVSEDLILIDDLIDYLKNRNSNLNSYEFFSLSRRIIQESLIGQNKIYSNKQDSIDFEKVGEVFKDDKDKNKEYYTSSYNAKDFCMVISFDRYYSKTSALDCPPLFYVVHNILIRKDMVRKSQFLADLSLTNAELDAIRKYEIIILHAMRYGAFYFEMENEIYVPKEEIKYVKIAYENIMYYANILNNMQKKKKNINSKVKINSNGGETSKVLVNRFEIKYEILENIPEGVNPNMWFTQKIDYELLDENKHYFTEMLRDLFGHKSFRPGQLDVIKNILENNIKNIPLSIFPTGYGKSLIYQYCAILEPQKTIVICPTEVLACDQIFNLNEDGLNIGKIVSCYEKNLNDRNGNLIYYTIPDVFLNYELNEKLSREDNNDKIYNIVLDECHNISLWGHQFDPTYFSLSKNIINNFKNCNVTMFTATASELVINDIKNQFSNCEIEIFQPVALDRGHINYQIKKVNNINDIIKDLSSLYSSNYKKGNNWDLNEETSGHTYKTLIINNDKDILKQIFVGLQENDYVLPYISQFNDSVGTYKSFRNGSKRVLLSNDDFVVGINIPELVNLVCVGVPPSKEWLYQESGRVGRNLEDSNVIIYIPNKPSELFNKMVDTTFDIKELLTDKKLQSQLNIDVSNINYFNSYFQDKERQLKEYDTVEKGIENNIYVVNNSDVGEINLFFEREYKETYNYLLYMLCLIDYIKSWQTKTSEDKNLIKYRMIVRDKIDLQDMANYLNEIVTVSTKNITVRNKYLRKNNLVETRKELLTNLLDWYYETIISIKREMLINTYELLLNSNLNSDEIEHNLAIYFDISNKIREKQMRKNIVIDNEDNISYKKILNEVEKSIEDEKEFYSEEDDMSVEDFENSISTIEEKIDEKENNNINWNRDKTENNIIVYNFENAYNDDKEINAISKKDNIAEESLKEQINVEQFIHNNISDNTDNEEISKVQIKEEKQVNEIKKSSNVKKNNKNIDKIMDIISNIYDDKNIDFDFINIYKSLNSGDKYNLQFILQREIESGYIYGYEMVMSMIELENKGSRLIRFNKFVKITNKQLLEMILEELDDFIPYANKRRAFKIIYSVYKPNNFKEWFRKLF